jgi:hypothetical protein
MDEASGGCFAERGKTKQPKSAASHSFNRKLIETSIVLNETFKFNRQKAAYTF